MRKKIVCAMVLFVLAGVSMNTRSCELCGMYQNVDCRRCCESGGADQGACFRCGLAQ